MSFGVVGDPRTPLVCTNTGRLVIEASARSRTIVSIELPGRRRHGDYRIGLSASALLAYSRISAMSFPCTPARARCVFPGRLGRPPFRACALLWSAP